VIQTDTKSTREQAAQIVAAGGVIAFRTDTFYGLGANPFKATGVQRVAELKNRDGKPILVVISDRAEVERFLVNESSIFTRSADAFWPGPLTLVGPAVDSLSRELTAGTGTIGLRLPAEQDLRALIRLCGGALTATSANISGQPPANSAQEVFSYFGYSVDLIIDGGEVEATQPSTVLDVTQAVPVLIREGAIARTALERVLGRF
jgi:L-threonylcarbamoyladenylate synthase